MFVARASLKAEFDKWELLGSFANTFQFQKLALGVSNGTAVNEVVGLFDYLEISLP